mmetsp:Transcript_74220/g.210130  ORF Transcript_74220/g.210130 Transcript_74220/m.210130 type:complete len:248 (+) Transcript_74220:1033-1776(+)
MEKEPLAQAAQVDEDPESKDEVELQLRPPILLFVVAQLQRRGPEDEDDQRAEQPGLPVQEGAEGNPAPENVRHHGNHGVAHQLRIAVVDDPLEGLSKLLLRINNQVLHVVVDPPHAVCCGARAPDQAVKQRGQQRRGILAEPPHNVRMPLEQGVHAVVVPVAVGANGEEVNDHRSGRLQAAGLDGPEERRDGLGANLDVEHPQGALAAWRTGDGPLQLVAGVHVDGLHDNGRALGYDPHEDARNKAG